MVDDDIVVENSIYIVGRRGIVGIIFVYKILGVVVEKGYDLDKLVEFGNKVVKNLKIMGMFLKFCIVFIIGKESFEIVDDEVEIGLGIYGEFGIYREKMIIVNEFIKKLFEKIYVEFNV